MKYLMFFLCTFLAILILPCLCSYEYYSKYQSIDSKDQFPKKNSNKGKHNYAIFKDWDEDWSDEDMMQHPIDETPRKARSKRPGEVCSYSSDCISGCCLLDRDSKIRSCQRKAIRGEKCTIGQVKGNLYVDGCPCASGNDFCAYPGQFCTQ